MIYQQTHNTLYKISFDELIKKHIMNWDVAILTFIYFDVRV